MTIISEILDGRDVVALTDNNREPDKIVSREECDCACPIPTHAVLELVSTQAA